MVILWDDQLMARPLNGSSVVLVELLMSSSGHFLLIMIVIYQIFCLYVQVSKMVPAIFFINFQGQGQRSAL